MINKIDTVEEKDILEAIDTYKDVCEFAEIIPVSALKGKNTDVEKINVDIDDLTTEEKTVEVAVNGQAGTDKEADIVETNLETVRVTVWVPLPRPLTSAEIVTSSAVRPLITPVSYTHLDVYKRQRIPCSRYAHFQPLAHATSPATTAAKISAI